MSGLAQPPTHRCHRRPQSRLSICLPTLLTAVAPCVNASRPIFTVNMSRSLAVVCTVLAACRGATAIELPGLPTVFSTRVQANIKNKVGRDSPTDHPAPSLSNARLATQPPPPPPPNPRCFRAQNYSISLHEWVDEDNNRARIDTYRVARPGVSGNSGRVTSLYLYDTDTLISVNESGCEGSALESQRFLPTGGTTGRTARIGSTAEMFRFGAQFDETYMGVAEARGIRCDHWTSNFQAGPVNMSLDWFFATEEWEMPEANGSRIPVRLVLTGTGPNSDGTPGMHEFEHVYDYSSFHVGLQGHHHHNPDDLFRLDCDQICSGTNFTQPMPRGGCEPAKKGHSSGAVAGAAVGGIVGGLLVGILCVLLVQRLRKGGSKYSPQVN